MTGIITTPNNVKIWYKTFGDIKNTAILLIMGNSCDAIMWPEQFCTDLSMSGFYVICFDQRDTGLSTYFDFKQTPYTLLDMVSDAMNLLDSLCIKKSHIVGFSTGATIAQLLTIHHPNRVLTLILMMTGMDLTIKNDAFAGKDMSNAPFPPPTKEFIDSVIATNLKPAQNRHEKILKLVQNFSLANGKIAPFDTNFFYMLFDESAKRTESRTDIKTQIGHTSNHALATSKTNPIEAKELQSISKPTLIIAGGQDPIFPQEHSTAMAKIITNAQLLTITNMGHVITPVFFKDIIVAIANHSNKQWKSKKDLDESL